MDQQYRALFNKAYTASFYEGYTKRMERALESHIPFRLAETPVFLSPHLRDRLATDACEIVGRICDPSLIQDMERAIPAEFNVPHRDTAAHCVQVDFAITYDAEGQLTGKLVELQGFASLYGLLVFWLDALSRQLATVPGLAQRWTPFFYGLSRDAYIERLRSALLGEHQPEEVILLDIHPTKQKTYPDFLATRNLVGIDIVCPSALECEGRRLVRRVGAKRVQVQRIYNRVVFDEIVTQNLQLPFSYRDDLDVTWVPHPNWYWMWSKYTLPSLKHPAVPKSAFLSDLSATPDDLSRYILKPLFGFGGAGVNLDPTRQSLLSIPEESRRQWLLQEKIVYAPVFQTPQGDPVKAEVRMMFLRGTQQTKPELVANVIRLSRGSMFNTGHNNNCAWTGGTLGLWPAA